MKLDVYTAVTGRAADAPAMASLLARMEATKPLESLENSKARGFALARDGGDSDHGERLFRTDQRLQCARCHRIGSSGSNIGPELTKIAKTRDSDYLLRAVVYPSADIEPKYNVQSVLLADGTVVQGVLKSETDAFLILINAKGEEVKLAVDDIEEVVDKKVSLMPDMTEVLSPQETRDIVAYLRSLR